MWKRYSGGRDSQRDREGKGQMTGKKQQYLLLSWFPNVASVSRDRPSQRSSSHNAMAKVYMYHRRYHCMCVCMLFFCALVNNIVAWRGTNLAQI